MFYAKDKTTGNISSYKKTIVRRAAKAGQGVVSKPSAFSLTSPATAKTVLDSQLMFDWSDSVDKDAFTYKLMISPTKTFATVAVVDAIPQSFYRLPASLPGDPYAFSPLQFNQGHNGLVYGQTYFWKVEAIDSFGQITPSKQVNSFTLKKDTTNALNGFLMGVVVDSNNNSVAGATVKVFTMTTTTAGDGTFTLIPPMGSSALTVSKTAYTSSSQQVTLAAGAVLFVQVKMTSTVKLLDTQAPVITLTGGNMSVVQGLTFTDPGSTVTDNVDKNLLASVTGVVNIAAVGTYTLKYNVSDAAGNLATTVARVVTVVATATPTPTPVPTPDTIAPVMTLLGASTVTVVKGSVYHDAGATAMDKVDGNVTANIKVTNTVNTKLINTYTVLYDVQDAAFNAAKQMQRVVHVIAAGGAAQRGSAVQVPLSGSSPAVEIAATGQVLSGFSSVASLGTPPTGVKVPMGVISYTTTVPTVGATQVVKLSFATPLPTNVSVYKVDKSGVYTLIPQGVGANQWSVVDQYTVALNLMDGGRFDLDGVADGVIVDPMAITTTKSAVQAKPSPVPTPAPVKATPIAKAAAPAPSAVASSGGCVVNNSAPFDPVLFLLLLLSLGYILRKRGVNK